MKSLGYFFKILKKHFLVFIKEHHFAFLLIVLFTGIAWVGVIFWQRAYLVTNAPVSGSVALVKVQWENTEKLEKILNERVASFTGTSMIKFPNLFR